MAQNVISVELKFQIILREHVSGLAAFGNYQILKLHDSAQDSFTPQY